MSLLRHALRITLLKPAPDVIPRSGGREAKVDCFLAYFHDEATDTKYLFRGLTKDGVSVQEVGQPQPQAYPTLTWEQANAKSIEFTHFLREYEFRYKTPWQFIRAYYTLRDQEAIAFDRAKQYSFNRRTLSRAERMHALRLLVDQRIERRDASISYVGLMSKMYTMRAFLHPDKDELQNYCELLLNSLVASDDLRREDGSYKVNPKALVTLSQWEEENRRHRDSVAQQRWIKIFTILLAIAAVIQACDIVSEWKLSWFSNLIGSGRP